MRSILIYFPGKPGRYEVRVSAGDDLPKWLDDTVVDSVYPCHSGQRTEMKVKAIHRAKHLDDHDKLNQVQAALVVSGTARGYHRHD